MGAQRPSPPMPPIRRELRRKPTASSIPGAPGDSAPGIVIAIEIPELSQRMSSILINEDFPLLYLHPWDSSWCPGPSPGSSWWVSLASWPWQFSFHEFDESFSPRRHRGPRFEIPQPAVACDLNVEAVAKAHEPPEGRLRFSVCQPVTT